ncbi:MAG: hypothetical protein GY841_15380 [FCB group bacterium]|nr:hypothetical protein [FCB group bacterium]
MILEIIDNSAPSIQEYRLMVGSINRAVSTVLAHEAFRLSNGIKTGLIEQRPGGKQIRPLKRSTILLRGIRTGGGKPGTKALIHSGAMVNSVTAKRRNRFHYTAGVHRNARSKDGKSLSNIAAIHEGGTKTYTVTVTEKMRRFSFVLMKFGILRAPWRIGQQLKRKIEARPWLGPAHEEWEKEADYRFTVALGAILGIAR